MNSGLPRGQNYYRSGVSNLSAVMTYRAVPRLGSVVARSGVRETCTRQHHLPVPVAICHEQTLPVTRRAGTNVSMVEIRISGRRLGSVTTFTRRTGPIASDNSEHFSFLVCAGSHSHAATPPSRSRACLLACART